MNSNQNITVLPCSALIGWLGCRARVPAAPGCLVGYVGHEAALQGSNLSTLTATVPKKLVRLSNLNKRSSFFVNVAIKFDVDLSVDGVGDALDAAVGQENEVGAGCHGPVATLVLKVKVPFLNIYHDNLLKN